MRQRDAGRAPQTGGFSSAPQLPVEAALDARALTLPMPGGKRPEAPTHYSAPVRACTVGSVQVVKKNKEAL